MSHLVPSSCESRARTSSRVSTTGTLTGHSARSMPCIHGSLVATKFAGMALAVEENETTHPVHVALFGPIAVMLAADRITQQVEQASLRRGRPNIMICHGFDLAQALKQVAV